jgi:hypothetical protein
MPVSTMLIVFGSWAVLLILAVLYFVLGRRGDDPDS